MQIIRLTLQNIATNHLFQFQFNKDATVQQVHEHLVQQVQGRLDTLELARRIEPHQRLVDVGVQTGDRLLLFAEIRASTPTALATPPQSGYRTLTVVGDDREMSSGSKTELRLGRFDGGVTPDIDMDYMVGSTAARYILPRIFARFWFDDGRRVWWMERIGESSVILKMDGLPVNNAVTLHNAVQLSFHRLSGQLICQFRVQIDEPVQTVEDRLPGRQRGGTKRVSLAMIVGKEEAAYTLRISDNLSFDQLLNNLHDYQPAVPNTPFGLYLARPLLISRKVESMLLQADEFLYAGQDMTIRTQNQIILKESITNKPFDPLAGVTDDVYLIGKQGARRKLAIDLSAVRGAERISAEQAELRYSQDSWWVQLAANARTAGFINTTRLSSERAMPLTNGDVLSFVPTVEHFNVRLVVDITSKKQTKTAEIQSSP